MASNKYEYVGIHYNNALVFKGKSYDPKKMNTKQIEDLIKAEPHTERWFKKVSGSSGSGESNS